MNIKLVIAINNEYRIWANELAILQAGGTWMDAVGNMGTPSNLMCQYNNYECGDCILMASTCSDNPGATLHPALGQYNEALREGLPLGEEDIPAMIVAIETLLGVLDELRVVYTAVATVHGKDGDVGVTTGASFPCRMAGCSGMRITTRWPDGGITHPCSKGMQYSNNTWTAA